MSNVSMINGHIDKHEEKKPERDRLIELLDGKSIDTRVDIEYVADYLLEKGVIVPPCKVGDKLYFLYNNNVFDLVVEKIVQKETGLFLVDKLCNDWYLVDEIGKTLYLTKEEALSKLQASKQTQ